MARRRSKEGGLDPALAPNLTPLLDVVLQLITFFMMLIHFGSKLEGETEAVRLPVAPAALPSGELGLDRLIVAIDQRGRLLTGGRALEEPAAAAWFGREASARRAGRAAVAAEGEPANDQELPTLVVVRADREAPYGAVRRLMAAAQESGFAQFSLIVLGGPER
jgi:biopolymer transport protein ExbD